MGMLAAAEAWTTRDHDAEWKQWEGWLGAIREQVERVPTVRTEKIMPNGPSNYAPELRISFDTAKIGATGHEIAAALLSGEPRIVIPSGESSLTVMPYMMMPGDDRIVAEKLRAILQNPPRSEKKPAEGGGTSVAGQWDLYLTFIRGEASHSLYLEEDGGKLRGQHRGEFLAGDIRGTRDGAHVRLRTSHPYEGTSLGYTFEGVVSGDSMTGTVDLGEYGKAQFTAKRHWV